MDYKEQIEALKNLEAIAYGYNINGEVLGMDCSDFEQIMVDAAEAITDLLARAEAADILGDNYDLDRLRELVEADRDGRCGIPPVKLHQTIYRVFDGKIIKETVCKAIWEPFIPRTRWKVWIMGSGLPYYWNDCIGKTVFLTREAAEAAMKGCEHQ